MDPAATAFAKVSENTQDVKGSMTEQNAMIRRPRPEDGHKIWDLVRHSGSLDLNAPYIYTLWCRDFSSTSAIAEDQTGVCGFVIAYARPTHPKTLFIWQAAVDPRQRGNRLAGRMLEGIVSGAFDYVECTVTPSNDASNRFLTAFARSRSAAVERAPLFGSELFPEGHEPEDLFKIGPIPHKRSGS